MKLSEILDIELLERRVKERYVRFQKHPTEPLLIYNYSNSAAYDRVWDDVTEQCRGLIVHSETKEIIARPWRKFFNLGEKEGLDLDPYIPVRVFDKLDGSLGVLHPVKDGWAIATRGSFTSSQAIRGTQLLQEKLTSWDPDPKLTYLWEILFPENRIVVDYGNESRLVLLDILETETGQQEADFSWSPVPEPWVDEIDADNLGTAILLSDRPNAEGIVIRFSDGLMLKCKQADYVALHRILTGTNARNVWETAAVKACAPLIKEPMHWGSYLGIDPARAEECLAVGDDWLENIPDEFHAWVRGVIEECEKQVSKLKTDALILAEKARELEDRRERYELVKDSLLAKEILRYVNDGKLNALTLRAWRESCPEPTAPFNRSEDVA